VAFSRTVPGPSVAVASKFRGVGSNSAGIVTLSPSPSLAKTRGTN
jgi:hypothetical protein